MTSQEYRSAGGRTLIARADGVWLWPGVPLAMDFDGEMQPLPEAWVKSWIARLHGFEAEHRKVNHALERAARLLAAHDEPGAQAALDCLKLDRLSPEGAILMRAVAARLGIVPPSFAVGTRSLPWGIGNPGAQVALFDSFWGAASELEKA